MEKIYSLKNLVFLDAAPNSSLSVSALWCISNNRRRAEMEENTEQDQSSPCTDSSALCPY